MMMNAMRAMCGDNGQLHGPPILGALGGVARTSNFNGGSMKIFSDTNCLPHNMRGEECQGDEVDVIEYVLRVRPRPGSPAIS
jgi:hypothetical protein